MNAGNFFWSKRIATWAQFGGNVGASVPNLQMRRAVLQREATRRHLSGTEVGNKRTLNRRAGGVSLPETRKSALQIYKKMEARGGEAEIWEAADSWGGMTPPPMTDAKVPCRAR